MMIFSQQDMQFFSFVSSGRRHYCDFRRTALVVDNLPPPETQETRHDNEQKDFKHRPYFFLHTIDCVAYDASRKRRSRAKPI